MLRLLRFSARNPPAMSWVRREPIRRVSSPVPGRSILMTFAPMSASSMVHMGPAMICVRSSTLTPARGPAGWLFWVIVITCIKPLSPLRERGWGEGQINHRFDADNWRTG